MKKYTKLTNKYIKTNKKRAISTTLAIVLSMAIMISFNMIFNAQENEQLKTSKNQVGYYDVRFNGLTNEQYDKLKVDDRLRALYTAKGEGAVIINKEMPIKEAYDLIKLTPETYENVFDFKILQGRLPVKENEILVDYNTANKFGISAGENTEVDFKLYQDAQHIPLSEVTFKGNMEGSVKDKDEDVIIAKDMPKAINSKKEVTYKVVGVCENITGDNKIYGYIDKNELLKSGVIDTFATLNSTKKTGWGEYGYGDEKRIADDLGLEFRQRSGIAGEGNVGSQVKYADYSVISDAGQGITKGNSTLIIVVVSVFMFAAIFNIFNISIVERTKQLGILRSIGATRKQITIISLGEANIYAVIGIPLGLLIGYFVTKGLFLPITSYLNVNISAEYLTIAISEMIKVGLLVYAMVIASASFGIAKQVKVTPIEAMNSSMGKKDNKVDTVGYNNFIESKKKIEVKLAHRNLFRNLTRNNMCTLVIAMSMVLFIFSISSFSMGIKNINVAMPSKNWDIELMQSSKLLNKSDKEKLKNINGVENIYSNTVFEMGIPIKKELAGSALEAVYESDKKFASEREYEGYYGAKVQLRVVNEDELDLYRNYLIDGKIDRKELSNNGALLINTGNKHYTVEVTKAGPVTALVSSDSLIDVNLGDSLKVPGEIIPTDKNGMSKYWNGKSVDDSKFASLKINGFLSEDALRENYDKTSVKELGTDFKLIITKECYEKNFGPLMNENIYVKTSENANRDLIKSEIENITSKSLYTIKDYQEIKDAQASAVKENLSIQIIFLASLLIIVVINIANTFYASVIMRKKEFASVRAIGMDLKQLRKMVTTEVRIIAMEATVWAIALGAVPTLFTQSQLRRMGMARYDIWFLSVVFSIIGTVILTMLSTRKSVRKIKGLNIVSDLKGEE